MNLSDFSVTWAYTRGGLYTGSIGSRGFRGAYTRGGLYTGGLILGVLRYCNVIIIVMFRDVSHKKDCPLSYRELGFASSKKGIPIIPLNSSHFSCCCYSLWSVNVTCDTVAVTRDNPSPPTYYSGMTPSLVVTSMAQK